jgi:hypothetical protein
VTPTGERVCDKLCVEGWMRGEDSKRYLAKVAKLRELMAG